MHEELVDRRRWISEKRFLHALNYCMLLPGPEAQQLATYLGWLLHRTWGGILAGVLFVLPSLFIIMALAWLYMAHGDMPVIAGIFYGIKPAVTALVAQAAYRVGSRSLKSSWHWGIAAAAFLAIFALNVPFRSSSLRLQPSVSSAVNCDPRPLVAPAMKKAMRVSHSGLH
jgi:chromate transporter